MNKANKNKIVKKYSHISLIFISFKILEKENYYIFYDFIIKIKSELISIKYLS